MEIVDREYYQGRLAELERQLAEVDALVSTHAYRIDPNSPNTWPKGSILAAAVRRHFTRLAVSNGEFGGAA